MRNTYPTLRRVAVLLLLTTTSPLPVLASGNGCASGGTAIVDAYFFADPMFALFFGDHLPTYIEQNAAHFRSEGDAVRCASALSVAYMQQAVKLYDPKDEQRRQQLETDLKTMGIAPGPADPSQSTRYLFLSARMAKLARDLPAAAEGDFAPLRTATSDIEQLQQQVVEMLRLLIGQTPEIGAAFQQAIPLMAELMQIDYRSMVQAARAIADGH